MLLALESQGPFLRYEKKIISLFCTLTLAALDGETSYYVLQNLENKKATKYYTMHAIKNKDTFIRCTRLHVGTI